MLGELSSTIAYQKLFQERTNYEISLNLEGCFGHKKSTWYFTGGYPHRSIHISNS